MPSTRALLACVLLLSVTPVAKAAVDAVDDEDQATPPAPKRNPEAAPARARDDDANSAPLEDPETFDEPGLRRHRRAKPDAEEGTSRRPPAPTGKQPATAAPASAEKKPEAAKPAAVTPPAPGPLPTKPLVLPKGSFDDLLKAFRARRQALIDQNATQVAAQTKALVELRQALAFPDLFTTAAALDRDAEKQLKSGLGPQALASATLAVELAPDLPSAWWIKARAELAQGFAGLPKAATSLVSAVQAEALEPRYLRTLLGNLAASAVLGGLIAAALTLALLLTLKIRYAMHDFHHLFPAAAIPLQTAVLFLIVLAIPWLFRLGPFAALASFVIASWLYLDRSERAATVLALGWILATPFLLGMLARWAVLSPTGEDLYAAERDLDSDLARSRLEALAALPHPAYPVLFALAHRAKRLGDLEGAAKLYQRILHDYPGRGDAENDLGTVLFLQGDLEGARKVYEAAISHDPGLAAAYFNLGQAFNRLLLLEQSQEAQRHALELDRAVVEPHVAGDDLRANRYLIDAALPWTEIAGTGSPEVEAGVRGQVEARIFGPLEGREPVAVGALAVLLAVLALAKRRVRPSSQCEKCGRPVCGRCDVDLAGEGLCGQCVNVFIRRAVADPPARIRKEAKVRAYQSFRATTVRALAILSGGAGHIASERPLWGIAILWAISFLLLNVFGVTEYLQTPTSGPAFLRITLALLFLLPIYGLAVRNVFVENQ